MINEFTPIRFGEKMLLVMNNDKVCLSINSEKYDMYSEAELQEKTRQALQRIPKLTQEKVYGMNTAYVFITESCNLNCEFCSMRSDQKNEGIKHTMSEQIVEEQLIPLLKKIGPRKVIVSGGEPLLHKNIISILKKLHDNLSARIVIQSNGTLLNENFITSIVGKIFCVEISTSHYADITVLERYINLMIENKIQITLSYVYENNLETLYKVIDFVAKYDLGFILNFVAPTGSALDNKHTILESKERLFVFRKVAEYILKNGYGEKQLAEIFTTPIVPSSPCGAYGKSFAVFPDGKIYMCHSLKYKEYFIGDLHTGSSSSILKKWRALIEDEKIKSIFSLESTPECNMCKFSPICGGMCVGEKHNGIAPECTLKKILMLYNIMIYNINASPEENLVNFLAFTDASHPYEKYMI